MYKIFLTVRNRLAITTKCIAALKRHAVIPNQIYVYENLTSYKIPEHFVYWAMLYEKGLISQVTFNSRESTYGAFSKASSCNSFGLQHEQDPKKDSYDFLLFMDNDIIVTPRFDEILLNAWHDIRKSKLDNIRVIGQLPGGIKSITNLPYAIGGVEAVTGQLGGSGFWCVKSDFFRDVGYLNLQSLMDLNKRHDVEYWGKMSKVSGGKDYIVGLKKKLCIHCGKIAGSTCNTLTRNKNLQESEKEKLIRFEKSEEDIDKMSFDEFYEKVSHDPDMAKDW